MDLAQTSGQTSGKHRVACHLIYRLQLHSIAIAWTGCHKQGLQSLMWFRLQRQACWLAGNCKLRGPRLPKEK